MPLPRRKASARHRVAIEAPELNLNAMMDLFAVLIPCLLRMSAVVEVTLLNVAAPTLSSSATPPPAAPKPPLNLTVLVTEAGYVLSGADAGLSASLSQARRGPPTIPLVQKAVSCGRFRAGWPPPRQRNQSQPACEDAAASRTFWVYDLAALSRRVSALKAAHPDERRITIGGEPTVEYEAIIDVMDATRDVQPGPGQPPRPLFDEVILSAGV